jgi:tetratricopeptide (TPR) repeat protein
MTNFLKNMTTIFVLALSLFYANESIAQINIPQPSSSKKASVSEWIGVTRITIDYGRPAVKGREGKIWGELVPHNFTNLGFGYNIPAPWRAGANENTVITFTSDVKVEGKDLMAGSYGFHIALAENGEATLIFSRNYTAWGSYYYKPEEDALRVTVKSEKKETLQEWLLYDFSNQTDNSSVVALTWEKLRIPFKVEVDLQKTTLASIRKELVSNKGFTWAAWNDAAMYCLTNNINLEEALTWADYSLNVNMVGEKRFANLSTKAMILEKLGKTTESQATMKEAMTLGNVQELHNYARQLQGQKKMKEAIEVFKLNAQRFPNQWPVNVGLTRAYSAEGNYKKALESAQLALKQAPDEGNKKNIENMINKLKEGKDVN